MISARLKQLRLARGLSLEALAAEMGGIVTKQALSKYEQDKAQPSREVLNKLAAALNVNATYLWSEPGVEVGFFGYRKRTRLTKKEQERIKSIVRQALEERVRLQDILQPGNGVDIPVQSLVVKTLNDAERAAEELRERWNLGLDPIASVTTILETHHVHVIEVKASETFDGISAVVRDDQGQIKAAAVVVRQGISGERQRFSLIHELAHLVLKVRPGCDEEKASSRFASAFLSPANIIYREVGSKRSFLQPQELLLLKQQFGMSVQAFLYRLRDLGIITESYYKRWCIDISKLGWRKQEPLEMPPEQPTWLRQGVLRAISEGVITHEEVQRMLGEDIEMEQSLTLIQRRAFMKLPLEERRRILAQQAEKMVAHYEEDTEWRELGGGDVVEY